MPVMVVNYMTVHLNIMLLRRSNVAVLLIDGDGDGSLYLLCLDTCFVDVVGGVVVGGVGWNAEYWG